MELVQDNPFAIDWDVVPVWLPDVYFRPPARSDQTLASTPKTSDDIVSEVLKQYLAHTYDSIPLVEILRAVDSAVHREQLEAGRQNLLLQFALLCQYTIEQLFYDPLGVLTWSVVEEMALVKGVHGISVNRLKDAMADLVDMGLLSRPKRLSRFSLVRSSQLTDAGRAVLRHIKIFELSSRQSAFTAEGIKTSISR